MLLIYSMPQSLSHLIVHAVFSTKDRQPSLHSKEPSVPFHQRLLPPAFPIQAERYRKLSYQEELRALLRRHRVAFDERYLWE
jgi:hypothetical protein